MESLGRILAAAGLKGKSESASPIKTYVLIGHDMQHTDVAYTQRGDAIILRAEQGKTFEDAVAQIKPPANVMLMAHGTENGTFKWHEKEMVSYYRLLQNLPRSGITTVMLNSCYGGLIQTPENLQAAPAGTMVQTMVSPTNVGVNSQSWDFIDETKGVHDSVGLYVKALDNFIPKTYTVAVPEFSKKSKIKFDLDPVKALPRVLGVGGEPHIIIDMDEQVQKLAHITMNDAQRAAWARAGSRAKTLLDGNFRDVNSKDLNLEPVGETYVGYKKLQADMHVVSQKILNGQSLVGKDKVETANNLRMAYALTALYLDESGQIKQMRKQQMQNYNAQEEKLKPIYATRNFIDKNTGIYVGQGGAVAQEVEAFAEKFKLTVQKDGVLSADELKAITGRLRADGKPHENMNWGDVQAMKQALLDGQLPTPKTPVVEPAKKSK